MGGVCEAVPLRSGSGPVLQWIRTRGAGAGPAASGLMERSAPETFIPQG